MRSMLLLAVVASGVTVFAVPANAQAESGGKGKVWLSPFATSLIEVCKEGWQTKGRQAERSKSYCLGFLYAIIGRLDLES